MTNGRSNTTDCSALRVVHGLDWVGLDWLGLGQDFSVFGGLGWVQIFPLVMGWVSQLMGGLDRVVSHNMDPRTTLSALLV